MFGQIKFARRAVKHLALAVVLLVALCTVNGAGPAAAAAATLYVSLTGSDANPCTSSLPCRTIGHAMRIAANGSTIRVAAGHYYENLTIGTTTGASLTRLAITGAGMSSTIIDGQKKGSVVTVSSLAFATISAVAIENGNGINGGGIANSGALLLNKSLVSQNTTVGIANWGRLTLTNSIVKSNSSPNFGAGLFNHGTVTVFRSTIANNTSAAGGGGIYNQGLLTLRQSTIAKNTAVLQGGGGIYADSGGTTTLVNSTVAGNSSGLDGGGIFSNGSGVSLYNTTIAVNKANTSLSGASGGGIAVNSPGSASLINTILASNLVARSGSPNVSSNDCEVLGGSAITSSGYNLVSTTTGCIYLSNIGDQLGKSALLGPLQKNGGPTQTMALQSGSPAIDAGNPAGCTDEFGALLTIDQRGDPRPHEGDGDGDNRCDIGAYEK